MNESHLHISISLYIILWIELVRMRTNGGTSFDIFSSKMQHFKTNFPNKQEFTMKMDRDTDFVCLANL